MKKTDAKNADTKPQKGKTTETTDSKKIEREREKGKETKRLKMMRGMHQTPQNQL